MKNFILQTILFGIMPVLANGQAVLSNANKIIFIDKARASFNKYGFDIPQANEDKFITAYEAMLLKPLTDENISLFIGNLEKLNSISFKEEDRVAISLFYDAMADKKFSDVEANLSSNAEEKSIFSTGSRKNTNLYEKAKAIPGLEKAAALLKENIDSNNIAGEYVRFETCVVMNEFMPELLVRIDPIPER